MTKIKFEKGGNEIINEAGVQAKGSSKPGREGLYPRELLEGAAGLCASMTLQYFLKEDGRYKEDTAFDIDVDAHLSAEGENRFSDFDIRIHFPKELDEAYIQELLVKLEDECTVGNTLKTMAKVQILKS